MRPWNAMRRRLLEPHGYITQVKIAAGVGKATHETLESEGRIFESYGATSGDLCPIASEEELRQWLACRSEAELVSLAAPVVRRIRQLHAPWDPLGLVIVKSGNKRGDSEWLDSLHLSSPTDNRKKPVLFVTWGQCFKGHQEEEGEEEKSATGGQLVGVLAGRALQLDGCVREFFEGKRGDDPLRMEDFGQLVDYHGRVPGVCRGMLFNARHFWLYESMHGHPRVLHKSTLSAPGSLQLARDFFTATPLPIPPTMDILRRLMGELGLESVPIGPRGAFQSFLGAGGTGRVFEVREGSSSRSGISRGGVKVGDGGATGRTLALKVVLGVSQGDLTFEFEQLEKAAAAGAPVVNVVPGSLRYFPQCKGGGYLMGEVLQPFEGPNLRPLSPASITAAWVALHQLHAKGFAHGDARLPNLMLRRNSSSNSSSSTTQGGMVSTLPPPPPTPVWIDLRNSHGEGGSGSGSGSGSTSASTSVNRRREEVERQRYDAFTLATSTLSLRSQEELPEALVPALENLVCSDSPDSYLGLAATLSALVKGGKV